MKTRTKSGIDRAVRSLRLGGTICLCTAALSLAQPTIDWFTVDGGGAMNSAGGAFSLSGTIGQPDAKVAPVMSGGTFELTGGFWPVTQVCYCLADMNGDGKHNGDDVQIFVNCIIAGGNCPCADVNGVNGVDLADVPAFVADLLAGNVCP
ncbi:MAG: hypothetical protein U1A27_10390 [Phycisphaerae bacterium]